MREIKFRGKKVDNGEWIYGNLIADANKTEKYFIIENGVVSYENNDKAIKEFINDYIEIIPKTIGQFTGLYDKNNTPVYEGDIVKSPYTNDDNLYKIACSNFGFMLQGQKDGNYYDFIGDLLGRLEVIGNIYDNEVEE